MRRLLLALVLLLACLDAPPAGAPTAPSGPPPVPPTPAPYPVTGSPSGGAPTGPPAAPPAPVAPLPLPLREAVALEPGGISRPLVRDGETSVDPAATFRIELAGAIRDARLILLDGQEALVPASAATETGDTTRLTLAPTAPLPPGSRFTLRVDGASVREVHDAQGAAYSPVALALRATGTPPAPEPRPKRKHHPR